MPSRKPEPTTPQPPEETPDIASINAEAAEAVGKVLEILAPRSPQAQRQAVAGVAATLNVQTIGSAATVQSPQTDPSAPDHTPSPSSRFSDLGAAIAAASPAPKNPAKILIALYWLQVQSGQEDGAGTAALTKALEDSGHTNKNVGRDIGNLKKRSPARVFQARKDGNKAIHKLALQGCVWA